jgi:hypothetical protein
MKIIVFFMGFLFFSSIVFAEGMTQKKVCNLLANGAEFCTTFNIPAGSENIKTLDEMNAELEKQSELKFTNDKREVNTEEINPINLVSPYKINNEEPVNSVNEIKEKPYVQESKNVTKKEEVKIEKKKSTPKIKAPNKPKLTKEELANKRKDQKDFSEYLGVIKSLDN